MELDVYLSEKQKKRKKRLRYLRLIALCSLICVLAIGAAWIVFRSPLFALGNIVIKGNAAVSSDRVTTLLQSSALRDHNFWRSLLGMKNILALPDSLSSSDLAFIPELASAAIVKDYFTHTVTAAVTERASFGIWCFMSGAPAADPHCYWFDAQGVLFGKAFDTQGSLLFAVHDYSQTGLGLNNRILPDRFLANFISIINVLKTSGAQVKEIALKDIGLEEIDVATYDGPNLYFSLRFPADNDLPVLQKLMAGSGFAKLQYVDFRVENRAYYK